MLHSRVNTFCFVHTCTSISLATGTTQTTEKVGVVTTTPLLTTTSVFTTTGNINKLYSHYIGYLSCTFYKFHLKAIIDYDDLMIFNKKQRIEVETCKLH